MIELKMNRFLVAMGTFISVTGLLYIIGYIFNIGLLIFHRDYTETSTGFYSESRSLLPVIIGVGLSYIAEKIYINRREPSSREN